jgi:Methyltransferase domain
LIQLIWLIIPLSILFSIVYWSVRNGISPTPSTSKQTKAILAVIPTQAKCTVYDLGSGWGNLAISIGRAFPDCHIIGIENSPAPFIISKLFVALMRINNVEFRYCDFMNEPIVDASVIVCYLYPGGMLKVKEKLRSDVVADRMVISNTFAIPGWEAIEVLQTNDIFRSSIYVYKQE